MIGGGTEKPGSFSFTTTTGSGGGAPAAGVTLGIVVPAIGVTFGEKLAGATAGIPAAGVRRRGMIRAGWSARGGGAAPMSVLPKALAPPTGGGLGAATLFLVAASG